MSGRVPESPLYVLLKPRGSQRLVVKIARAVTYQWLSGRGRGGVALSAPDTLVVLDFKNEHFVSAPSRANGLCYRPRAEINAELKTISHRILTLIGGLSK
jgi:hypothetical protein